MRGRSRFSPSRYRRERLVALERRVEFLEAERRRLERLLGQALRVAVHDSAVSPLALLDALCLLEGTDPAIAAWVEARRAEAA
jgi:hypothetical protein